VNLITTLQLAVDDVAVLYYGCDWQAEAETKRKKAVDCRNFYLIVYVSLFIFIFFIYILYSVLWHCWLGVRKRTRPGKIFSDNVPVWLSVWSEVQIVCIWSSWCHCIPNRRHLFPHLHPYWFYLFGSGLPRSSWKRGRWMDVVVVVICSFIQIYLQI